MKSLPERKKIGPSRIEVIVLLLLFFFADFPTHASNDSYSKFDPSSVAWELYYGQGDTKIYQAAPLPSGLVPLKASTVFNHPLRKVYSVLYDAKRKPEWVPHLKESHLVKKFHPGRYITYARYDSPWPFKDRSALVDTVDHYDPVTGIIKSTINTVKHPNFSPKDNEVRIYTKGFSTLKEVDGGKKCYGEIVLINDFKGNIPIWLINFVQKKWPLKMFSSLRKQLKKNDIKTPYGLVMDENKKKD